MERQKDSIKHLIEVILILLPMLLTSACGRTAENHEQIFVEVDGSWLEDFSVAGNSGTGDGSLSRPPELK